MTDVYQEALAQIGRRTTHKCEVTAKDIRRYAQAIGDSNPLYIDPVFASTTHHHGVVAPPLFCHSLAFDDVPVQKLRPDGIPSELDIKLPSNHAVGGAGVFEPGVDVRPGDVISVTVEVANIYEKVGKSGPLYFVEIESVFTNQNQELVAREVATFISR
jgi:acyl dehydratase